MSMARRSIRDVRITAAMKRHREAIRDGKAMEDTPLRLYMGPTPSEPGQLTPEMRSCASSALSLKDSAFNDRMKIVLLKEEDFTRLMALFAEAREQATIRNALPKLFLRHIESLISKVDSDSLRHFFTLVENDALKLSEALSYGTRVQVRKRKFMLSHCLPQNTCFDGSV